MKRSPHSHPCMRCGAAVTCAGKYEPNPDGWPEVICRDFHLVSGRLADVLCDEHSNYDREDLTAPDAWEGGFARNH